LLFGLILSVWTRQFFQSSSITAKQTPTYFADYLFAICQNKKEREICYTDSFAKITKEHTLSFSLSVLSALQRKDGVTGCHFIAHVIAGEEVDRDPEHWSEVIKRIPVNDCTGGFIMGAMEARSKYENNVVLDAPAVEYLCGLVRKQTQQQGSDQTCVHTMGHLLLVEKAGDINKAIAVCGEVKMIYQEECYAGIFMEHEFGRNLALHGVNKVPVWDKALVQENIALCESYTGVITSACWREISHMFIFLAKSNPKSVYEQCSLASQKNLRDSCYLHAVGVMTLSSDFEPKRLASLCTITEDKRRCSAMIRDTLLNTSNGYGDKVKVFCKEAGGC
jgi:hypothetical protein